MDYVVLNACKKFDAQKLLMEFLNSIFSKQIDYNVSPRQ